MKGLAWLNNQFKHRFNLNADIQYGARGKVQTVKKTNLSFSHMYCVSKKNLTEINGQHLNRNNRHSSHYGQVTAARIVYLRSVVIG